MAKCVSLRYVLIGILHKNEKQATGMVIRHVASLIQNRVMHGGAHVRREWGVLSISD